MDKYEKIIAELCDFIDKQVYYPIQGFIKSLIEDLRNVGIYASPYDFGSRKEDLKMLIETNILDLKKAELGIINNEAVEIYSKGYKQALKDIESNKKMEKILKLKEGD